MTSDVFNSFAALGILLTFATSLIAIIVSIISLNSTKKIAKQTGYLNSITTSRKGLLDALRDNSSLYFTQINRLCRGKEENLVEIYNELTRYHFAILLSLLEDNKKLHDDMSAIRSKAIQIIEEDNIINNRHEELSKDNNLINIGIDNDAMIIKARQAIGELRIDILNHYQGLVFDAIRALIENEWKKQQYEATEMWDQKQLRVKRFRAR